KGPIGVFVGVSPNEYGLRFLADPGLGAIDAHSATGNFSAMAAGRIAHALGFGGPALTIDTACSSSLVAVSLAIQSLRAGHARIALAGGASLIVLPVGSVQMSRL